MTSRAGLVALGLLAAGCSGSSSTPQVVSVVTISPTPDVAAKAAAAHESVNLRPQTVQVLLRFLGTKMGTTTPFHLLYGAGE